MFPWFKQWPRASLCTSTTRLVFLASLRWNPSFSRTDGGWSSITIYWVRALSCAPSDELLVLSFISLLVMWENAVALDIFTEHSLQPLIINRCHFVSSVSSATWHTDMTTRCQPVSNVGIGAFFVYEYVNEHRIGPIPRPVSMHPWRQPYCLLRFFKQTISMLSPSGPSVKPSLHTSIRGPGSCRNSGNPQHTQTDQHVWSPGGPHWQLEPTTMNTQGEVRVHMPPNIKITFLNCIKYIYFFKLYQYFIIWGWTKTCVCFLKQGLSRHCCSIKARYQTHTIVLVVNWYKAIYIKVKNRGLGSYIYKKNK